MISFSSFIQIVFLLTNALGLYGMIVFEINQEHSYYNRKVFVRNFDQIYNCHNEWKFLSNPKHSGWKLLNGNRSIIVNKHSNVGFTRIQCLPMTLDLVIIDGSQYDMTVFPSVPKTLDINNDYVFQIFFEPDIINKDKTYTWYPEQTSGYSKLTFETTNNILVIHINKDMILGDYSIAVKSQYNMVKEFSFSLTPYVERQRSAMIHQKHYNRAILKGFNKFFYGYIAGGTLVTIILFIIYIVSFFGKRSPFTEFAGYRDVELEEKELLKQRNNMAYKIMDNPMNKEKDVNLFYRLFKEYEADITGNFSADPPYVIDSAEIQRLQEQFPDGICLNCVKFVGQLLIMDKTDCPFIRHTCDIPPGQNFDKAINCKCLKLETEDIMDMVNNDFVYCCGREDGDESCDGKCRFAPKVSNSSNIAGIEFMDSMTNFKELSHNLDSIENHGDSNSNNATQLSSNKLEIHIDVGSKRKIKGETENRNSNMMKFKKYSTNSTQNLVTPIMETNSAQNPSGSITDIMCQNKTSCLMNEEIFKCRQCMTEALKYIIKKKLTTDLETSADIRDLETDEDYCIVNYKSIRENLKSEKDEILKHGNFGKTCIENVIVNSKSEYHFGDNKSDKVEKRPAVPHESWNINFGGCEDGKKKCQCHLTDINSQDVSQNHQQPSVRKSHKNRPPILYSRNH